MLRHPVGDRRPLVALPTALALAPLPAEGVEGNTRGCAGHYIVTSLQGALRAKPVSGQRSWWWDLYDDAAARDRDARLVDNRTGLAIVPYGPDYRQQPNGTEAALFVVTCTRRK